MTACWCRPEDGPFALRGEVGGSLALFSWEVAADVPTRLARARCHLAAKKTVPSAPSSSPLSLRRAPLPFHAFTTRVHASPRRRRRRHGAVIRNCYRPPRMQQASFFICESTSAVLTHRRLGLGGDKHAKAAIPRLSLGADKCPDSCAQRNVSHEEHEAIEIFFFFATKTMRSLRFQIQLFVPLAQYDVLLLSR